MIQEDKELLLKDLCARLTYGVKVKIYNEALLNYGEGEIGIIDGKEVSEDDHFTINTKTDRWIISINEFKPYLRPMTCMTDEEKADIEWYYRNSQVDKKDISNCIDYFNSHHLDYHNLIPMGLALEAKEGMYEV